MHGVRSRRGGGQGRMAQGGTALLQLLKTVVDQHFPRHDQCSSGAVTAAALASELASQDASISGLQASKAERTLCSWSGLQDSGGPCGRSHRGSPGRRPSRQGGRQRASLPSTVDGLNTPLDTKIANVLLGLATEAFVAAR